MKKKLLFVAHPYHVKTKSYSFLTSLFKKQYTLRTMFSSEDDLNRKSNLLYEASKKYDTVLFFQVIPAATILKRLRGKNVVWVPMLDNEKAGGYYRWFPYIIHSNLKIIAFSNFIYKRFLLMGFPVLNIKYYPEVSRNVVKNTDNINIYFWQRKTEIDWETVKKLIGRQHVNSVIYRPLADPNNDLIYPDNNDFEKYNIRIVKGWLTKKKSSELIRKCNVYIAPRMYEGLGHSFIEPMAMGICVIAPNNPTMNEYIINGRNGILYDPENIKEVDLSNLQKIRRNAYKLAKQGRKVWIELSPKILDFVSRDFHEFPLRRRIIRYLYINYKKYSNGRFKKVGPFKYIYHNY